MLKRLSCAAVINRRRSNPPWAAARGKQSGTTTPNHAAEHERLACPASDTAGCWNKACGNTPAMGSHDGQQHRMRMSFNGLAGAACQAVSQAHEYGSVLGFSCSLGSRNIP